MHVYELIDDQLVLIGRLYLPDCKHRWLTSFAVLAIFEAADDDSEETIFLATGDKCGNLYVYTLANKCSLSELDESLRERSARLMLVEAVQSFQGLVKDKLPVSAIYSKKLGAGSYQVICCCKDGFYRVFELSAGAGGEEGNVSRDDDEQVDVGCRLRYVNKYQVNSYVDLIESFVFDAELTGGKE